MKKVILCICGAAIIALAAVNVNLALKSGKFAKFSRAHVLALADPEDPEHWNTDGCDTEEFEGLVYHNNVLYGYFIAKKCVNGYEMSCEDGEILTQFGTGESTGSITDYLVWM